MVGTQSMLFNFLSIFFKFAFIAVAIGAILGAFDITATDVLKDMGLAPDRLSTLMRRAFQWAVPHFVLGAMVIVPVWLVIFLLKPPRIGR